MPEHLITIATLVVDLIKSLGVECVFAYPGTSELALCQAVERDGDIRLINARGDKEAVFMAAGANRVAPHSAAALLHGARGLTNALGAIADARRSEVAVLCIVGLASRTSSRFLPPHEEPDLIQSAAAFAKGGFQLAADPLPGTGVVEMLRAALDCLSSRPYGPVLLGIPQDVTTAALVTCADRDRVVAVRSEGVTSGPPDRCRLDAAATSLLMARRPVVLVDDYLFETDRASHACAALGRLAHRLDAPVFQVAYRRGPMLFERLVREQVPTLVGFLDPGDAAHRAILESADLLVTIEDRNMYPRVVGGLPACRKLAISTNPRSTYKNGYASESDMVVGACSDVLEWLAARLNDEPPRHQAWRAGLGNAGVPSSDCDPVARQLVRALATGLQSVHDLVLVDDSQIFGGLVMRNHDLLPAIRTLGSHGGFVGSGLATATGVAVTHLDRSVACLVGDQGLTNGIQALAVAAEQESSLLVVVCNNGSSVSLALQAAADGLHGLAGSTLLRNVGCLDYAAAARAYGFSAETLTWPDTVGPPAAIEEATERLTVSVTRALSSRRPHLLEILTSANPEFWRGVWNSSGYEPAHGVAGRVP